MRGVLAPLTNVLGRKRPRSLLPSSSDSDVNSDGDEDIQPVGARIGHRYTPRPVYILRSSFRYNHGARDAVLLRSHREETLMRLQWRSRREHVRVDAARARLTRSESASFDIARTSRPTAVPIAHETR